MKKLFEDWRKLLKENNDNEDLEGLEPEDAVSCSLGPKVTCNCACTDCIFNENLKCIAEEINLDWAQTESGDWICECKTYEVPETEIKGPEEE
jgi:hypothetical protein